MTTTDDDVLSLSGLELRKEVWSRQGHFVDRFNHPATPSIEAFTRYALVYDGEMVNVWRWSQEEAWEDSPPLEIAHTLPLAVEMTKWGWDVDIRLSYDDLTDARLAVSVKYVGRAPIHPGVITVESDSYTDPSDAIAKCWLLARKEMNP